ncbi:MAG: SIS domain-containing protein [Gammaproteobacteria bacterium]|nr:SIS domain-containing protein [Gammaproteobacteria bacterium]
MMSEHVRTLFARDIEAKISLVDVMSDLISDAGQKLVNCLLADGRIFIAGNGGSSANCLHFSAAMLHCFEVARPTLPVIHLLSDVSAMTAIANDGHFDQLFARQIQALGQAEDVVIVLTTSGQSKNMKELVAAAHDKGLTVIALTGRDGGDLTQQLGANDMELRVPGDQAARIRETHLFILHCFCDVIDRSLFGVGCV